jgi:hypothetical protein
VKEIMKTSTFPLQNPISPQMAASYLSKACFGPIVGQATPEAVLAEMIRIALWELSVLEQPSANGMSAVSTQRILRRVRMLYEPFTATNPVGEQPGEDELDRETLDELAEQGDMLSLPRGQWLPAPLRLVPAASTLYLLVGSLPSSLLASSVLQGIRLHGSFRQLDADLLQHCPTFDGHHGHWQFQTLESWLGAPVPTLKQLQQQFQEIETAPVMQAMDAQQPKAYIASLDQPQALRWRSPEQVPHDGRYLLRKRNRWGQVSYSIGEIEKQQITKESQHLETIDIRRLCYALDDQAQMPTSVQWNRDAETLVLRSLLPARERKRLATLGTLRKNSTHFYPRIWYIDRRYEEEVHKLLTDLAITIH